MRSSVRAAWHAFSEPLEGRVRYMYLDSANPEGYVTTGVGNLIDPMSMAMTLPWRRADGTLASQAEIATTWLRVKNMQVLRHRSLPQRSDPTLHLTDEDIDKLVDARLANNHEILRRRWPSIDEWPADAQLAIHSWAWAVGPHAGYPRMTTLLAAGDFEGAARESTINPQRGTIVERNRRNRVCLTNAARVVAHGLDPAELYWPRPLAAEFGEPETQRELPPDSSPTVEIEVPSARPAPLGHVAIIRPRVPLGRPALDGGLSEDEINGNDPEAA